MNKLTTGVTAGMALFNGALQQPSLRHFLQSLLPQPSSGLNEDELPEGRQRSGILTPATGLAEILAQRLRKAGMIIEIKVVEHP